MKTSRLITTALVAFISTSVLGAPDKLSPADQAAAFKAAGFKLKGKRWQACDDPTPTYSPGAIEDVRDINGDGLPEAVITEGGTYCYGNTPTLADCCLVPQIFNGKRFDVNFDGLPRTMAAFDACMKLEAFQQAQPSSCPDNEA